jgi:hypothetical protein
VGVPRSSGTYLYIDDGIVIQNGSSDAVDHNYISGFFDFGIELAGHIVASDFNNNTIVGTTSNGGIGGFASNTHPTFSYLNFYYNDISYVGTGFWFGGGCGYFTGEPSGKLFSNTTFYYNNLHDYIGTSPISFVAYLYQVADWYGSCTGDATASYAADVTISNNTFTGNAFGAYPPIFSSGNTYSLGATYVTDGGSNTCTAPGYSNYPITCH